MRALITDLQDPQVILGAMVVIGLLSLYSLFDNYRQRRKNRQS